MNREFSSHTRSRLTFFSGLLKKAFESLKIVGQLAVIPTLILAWYQLHDIAQANKMTAEKYISDYEKNHHPKWDKIDDLEIEIRTNFEQQNRDIDIPKEKFFEAFDTAVIKGIEESQSKGDIDQMAFHFRSVLFCMKDDGRCDEERVLGYYKPYICNFVQKTYGYLVSKYDRNAWRPGRGDLIAFNKDYDCAKLESQTLAARAPQLSGRNRSRRLSRISDKPVSSGHDMVDSCGAGGAHHERIAQTGDQVQEDIATHPSS